MQHDWSCVHVLNLIHLTFPLLGLSVYYPDEPAFGTHSPLSSVQSGLVQKSVAVTSHDPDVKDMKIWTRGRVS